MKKNIGQKLSKITDLFRVSVIQRFKDILLNDDKI